MATNNKQISLIAGRKINKPNNNSNKIAIVEKYFSSRNVVISCRYCNYYPIRHSQVLGDCEVDVNDIDKIIAYPHICNLKQSK